ncbi:hypothetical protein DFAR_2920008 [Desulfarculales bacterium]
MGVTALATGHHLDDEAGGRLLGNTIHRIHRHEDHLAR